MPINDDRATEFDRLPQLTRRKLLAAAGGSAVALGFLMNRPDPAAATPMAGRFSEDPFTLGVASGDPLPTSVVLWTRLVPKPYEPDGGMPPHRTVPVRWQVATDEGFGTIVRQGTEIARPEYAFSVHVDVAGLEPDRVYYYRFSAGGQLSEVGRTRTAPDPKANHSELSFAFASCNSFGAGWFSATDHLAAEDVDVIFFLGDYIYEYGLVAENMLRDDPQQMPVEFAEETGTLERYRMQYAAYKHEPELRHAHRVAPWIVTWDDHELENDYGADGTVDLVRRANAYRAYWEHMPLRSAQLPTGPDARLYRRFDFGRLAQVSMLDVRQYRSAQVDTDKIRDSEERRDPARTILGDAQERWYLDGLTSSTAQWNISAQGVLMSMLDSDPTEDQWFAPAAWDGYQASQQRVLDTVADGVDNFVVLTGDIHRNYMLDMLASFDDPDSAVVGAEFAATSLSSGGDGVDSDPGLEDRFEANPHLRWASLQRGYARGRVTPEQLQIDVRQVPYVTRHGAPVTTAQSFVVESGTPGIQLA